MVFSTPPCHGCTERNLHCHESGKCPKHDEWQAHEQAIKAERNRQLDLNYSLYESKREKHRKFVSRVGRSQLRGRPVW